MNCAGRSKPTIEAWYYDKETHKEEQICSRKDMYAVFFDGAPFSLRIEDKMGNTGFKYKPTSSIHRGTVIRLAKRLNELHDTNLFTVCRLEAVAIIET